MPEESNLPEKTKPEKPEVVDLDKNSQKPKQLIFSKTKFIVISIALILLILAEIPVFYVLGSNSAKSSNSGQIEKTETKKTQNEPDVKNVGIDEEVVVKSGVTLMLEEAKHNDSYEQQKNESKSYYENNASQSAYLNSDYFKNSQLDLKISLNNTTKEAISYSPSSFRLKDSQDVQYVASYEGDKQIYGLNPDEKTRLTLSYIVPTSEKNFQLVYENAVIEFKVK